VIIVLQL